MMLYKVYHKYKVICIFLLLCSKVINAQSGTEEGLYLSVNLNAYSVSAFTIISDSSRALSDTCFTTFIEMKVKYFTKNDSLCKIPFLLRRNKIDTSHTPKISLLLLEIIEKESPKNRMTILIVGNMNLSRSMFELDINFSNGLYMDKRYLSWYKMDFSRLNLAEKIVVASFIYGVKKYSLDSNVVTKLQNAIKKHSYTELINVLEYRYRTLLSNPLNGRISKHKTSIERIKSKVYHGFD